MSWDRLRQVRLEKLARLEADAMDQLYAEPQGSARLLAVQDDETGTGTGGGTGTGTGDGTGTGTGDGSGTGTGDGSGTGGGTGTGSGDEEWSGEEE